MSIMPNIQKGLMYKPQDYLDLIKRIKKYGRIAEWEMDDQELAIAILMKKIGTVKSALFDRNRKGDIISLCEYYFRTEDQDKHIKKPHKQ